MKKQSFLLFITMFIFLTFFSNTTKAEINVSDENLYNNLKGKIILRVEANGEAYYVHPSKQKMYFLGRPDDAFKVMREQGIGISNADIERIKIADSIKNFGNDINFANKQKGKIFLQVEENGEAWYVNPNDSMRYFLGRPSDAFNVMRNLGLGVSDSNFSKMEKPDWKTYKNSDHGFEFEYPSYLMFQNDDPTTQNLWRVDQHEELIVDQKNISGIHAPEWQFELNKKKNDNDIIVEEIKKDNYKLITARPYQMLGCFYYIESTNTSIQFSTLRECNDKLSLSLLSTFKLTK